MCVQGPVHRGFTLIELLAVIGIIALLAALLLPLILSAKENARRSACSSGLQSLGMALTLYAQDNNEQGPNGTLPPRLIPKPLPSAMGWAGRIFGYVKNTSSYHCPDDPTGPRSNPANRTAYPVSFGLNSNLSLTPQLSAFAAPAKTVWLFEVAGNRACVKEPSEGVEILGPLDQLSAIGDGTNGSILAEAVSGTDRRTRFATGLMDNYAFSRDGSDDYQGESPRHREGANYLALDGHVAFVRPEQISAGRTAASGASAQTSTGCTVFLPTEPIFPCAAGTADVHHTLTFSVR